MRWALPGHRIATSGGGCGIWLLYDDVSTGHHLPFLGVIESELRRRGIPTLIATADVPRPDLDPYWIRVPSLPHRAIGANRRRMSRLAAAATEAGVDTLVDLFFDKNAWAAGSMTGIPRRVHVMHHTDQLVPGARSGWAGVRSSLLRRMSSRASRGSVVVHTPEAARQVGAVLGAARVFQAPYPVEVSSPSAMVEPSGPINLAFVGGARHEKGLDLLARAVRGLRRPVQVVVFGAQDPGTLRRLTPQFRHVPVHWVDDDLDVTDMRRALSACHLMVLPYRSRFGMYGGSSASLLDAMAAGVPVVVTSALASQLPSGYGAVVTPADDPDALARGIEWGLDDLGQLQARAREIGPVHVREFHAPSRYVEVLVDAAEASRL